ncbi:hypothetical protein AB9K34_05000 [Sedimentitalea sp. XS_ASV28]|uniref:hypothetical protein n=1 Tax=Sedimentitalea sp. XS_ASV28 TaxID=3241296 RepID=UPI0035190788
MYETLLATTSSEGLQPLGSAAQRSYELVSDTVRNRLSSAHANLFAEPVATEHGDMIDWYAPIEGTAQPLTALDEEAADALRARLGGLIGDIRREAESLAESPEVQDQRLAEALGNAIEIPSEAMIYALRQPDGAVQPVLVHWAWLGAERQSVRGILTTMVPRAQSRAAGAGQASAAPDAVQAVRTRSWWWLLLLGWLLLAAMLACILYLLIAPCGLQGGQLFFCPEPPAEVSEIPLERQVLEAEIAALEHEIALVDRACQPTIPVGPAAPDTQTPTAPTTPGTTIPVPFPLDKTKFQGGAREDRVTRLASSAVRMPNPFMTSPVGRDGPSPSYSATVRDKAPERPLNTSVSR